MGLHLIYLWITGKRPVLCRRDQAQILSFFAFCIWLFISLFWTPSRDYAVQKAIYFPILSTAGLLYALAQANAGRTFFREVSDFTILLSFVFALPILISFISNPQAAVISLNGNRSGYLGLSRFIGISSVIAGYRFISGFYKKTTSFILLCFLGFLLLIIGGRTPLVAFIILIMIMTVESTKLMRFKIKLKGNSREIYVVLFIVILYFLLNFNTISKASITISRLLIAFSSQGDSSLIARISHYRDSIRLFSQNPLFGYGVGSYPLLVGEIDSRYYPHNIVLEVLVENGVIGFLLLITFFGTCAAHLIRVWDKRDEYYFIAIYLAINSFVSGDLNDNRLLFFYIIMAGGIRDQISSRNNSP